MPWTNGRLILYHGTDDGSANTIMASGVSLGACRSLTDFGKGFYLSADLHQAKNWANSRYRRLRPRAVSAAVVQFQVDRNDLALLANLSFHSESANVDYWDFVRYCRGGATPHGYTVSGNPISRDYDVVSGPVSLWPQYLVIKDCDQWSFHTATAVSILSGVSVIVPTAGPVF